MNVQSTLEYYIGYVYQLLLVIIYYLVNIILVTI